MNFNLPIMNDLPPFQYFGSADSLDVDVVFFIEQMPDSIKACAELCAAFAAQIQAQYGFEKKVNANLARVKDGILTETFKGNTDELNNALFYTASLHEQIYQNPVTKTVVRNLDLKIERTVRMVLSYLTKTNVRATVKQALRGTREEKMKTLEGINLESIVWDESKSDLTEVKKSLAFQLGQTLLLLKGTEVYTKKEIAALLPELELYLYRREGTDFGVLQVWLSYFVNIL